MKKICIAPFFKELIPLLTVCPDGYEISSVVSPGTDIEGIDISVLTNRNHIGVSPICDLQKCVATCDIVLISDIELKRQRMVDDEIINPLIEFVHEGILMAIQERKDIFCFTALSESDKKKYAKMARERHIKFKCFDYESVEDERDNKQGSLHVPVIFIGEMMPGCDGYEIFLKLFQRLKGDGFNVIAISEDKYNALYKQHYIRFWNDSKPETNVYTLRNHIYILEETLCPDVIIVKLPNPMTVYSDLFAFDFGISAYMIAQAVHADYFLYCSLYGYWSVDFLTNMDNSFRAKFGVPISAVHFSNLVIDETSEAKTELSRIYLPKKKVSQEIEYMRNLSGSPLYDLLETGDFELFYQNLKTQLFAVPYGVVT